MVKEKMTAIADTIRSHTGKTDKLFLDDMPNEIENACAAEYEKGFAAGQAGGAGSYEEGFADGKDEILQCIDGLYSFFYQNQNMNLFPAFMEMDLSKIKNWQYTFASNTKLTEFHAPVTMYTALPHGMFQNCTSLTTVSGLERAVYGQVLTDIFNGCTGLVDCGTLNFQGVNYTTRAFQNCTALEEIRIVGNIGLSVDIHWSTKLTKASIESIITHLSDTATGKTLTLSKTAVDNAFHDPEGEDVIGSASADWNSQMESKPNWTFTLV